MLAQENMHSSRVRCARGGAKAVSVPESQRRSAIRAAINSITINSGNTIDSAFREMNLKKKNKILIHAFASRDATIDADYLLSPQNRTTLCPFFFTKIKYKYVNILCPIFFRPLEYIHSYVNYCVTRN